jgi:urease accessory protein
MATMLAGAALGSGGAPLPAVELFIAGSALLIGLVVALRLQAPSVVAIATVAAVAAFHGHAHGQEMPLAADPLAYGAGMLLATGLLHLNGIGIGRLAGRVSAGSRLVRGTGAGIAACGALFLVTSVV